MKLRIGTWNIAAARKMVSTERFDYSPDEELPYFAEEIRRLDLDVICLQESHANEDDSMARRLGKLVEMPNVEESIGCPSHIDILYNLNTAVLSKQTFVGAPSYKLPRPPFELRFKHDGRAVPPYDRYLQVVDLGTYAVANMWTEPLGAFGRSYEADEGKSFAAQIDELLVAKLERPLLFAADFNIEDVAAALPQLVETFRLKEALPDMPTKPHGNHPDHILYSPEWKKLDSGVVQTQSDHYLCWAEFEK